MQSAECAECFKGDHKEYGYISFDMRDRLKCIYTVWIKAWTVDDWIRVRAVHLNHHLMRLVIWCLMSLST